MSVCTQTSPWAVSVSPASSWTWEVNNLLNLLYVIIDMIYIFFFSLLILFTVLLVPGGYSEACGWLAEGVCTVQCCNVPLPTVGLNSTWEALCRGSRRCIVWRCRLAIRVRSLVGCKLHNGPHSVHLNLYLWWLIVFLFWFIFFHFLFSFFFMIFLFFLSLSGVKRDSAWCLIVHLCARLRVCDTVDCVLVATCHVRNEVCKRGSWFLFWI